MLSLQVKSTPRGARVERMDTGEVLGTTPLATQLPAMDGTLKLRLTAPGHAAVERRVAARGQVQLEVPLPARRQHPAPAAAAAERTATHAKHPDPFTL